MALHQDLSIPVAERIDSALCTGWSAKEGDLFVQPPMSVLEDLVAVRVHLDDCDERNGALRVVLGSHRLGRLSSVQALNARVVRGEHVVPVPRGGVMMMRPLLLHASSKATVNLPRRVLHFVFGPSSLPELATIAAAVNDAPQQTRSTLPQPQLLVFAVRRSG